MAEWSILTAIGTTLVLGLWPWPGVSNGSRKPVSSNAMTTMLEVTKTSLLCTGNVVLFVTQHGTANTNDSATAFPGLLNATMVVDS